MVADRIGRHRAFFPANIQPRQVGHLERPHFEAESVERRIDIPRQHAAIDQGLAFALTGGENAIADKARADADKARHFADFDGNIHRGGDHIISGFFRADDFQ